jgi:hypothetical protein
MDGGAFAADGCPAEETEHRQHHLLAAMRSDTSSERARAS